MDSITVVGYAGTSSVDRNSLCHQSTNQCCIQAQDGEGREPFLVAEYTVTAPSLVTRLSQWVYNGYTSKPQC
jgi:hypothetical protein